MEDQGSTSTQYLNPQLPPGEAMILPSSSEAPELLVEEGSTKKVTNECNAREIILQHVQPPPIRKRPSGMNNRQSLKRTRVKHIGKRRRLMLERIGALTIDKRQRSNINNESQRSMVSISTTTVPTQSFVRSKLPNFWHCPKCEKIPINLRAKHSVFFCGGHIPPTNVEYPSIRTHFELCEKRCLELKDKEFQNLDANEINYYSDNTLPDECNEVGGRFRIGPHNSRKSRRISNQKKIYDGDTSETYNQKKRNWNFGTDTATDSKPKPKRRRRSNTEDPPTSAQDPPHLPRQLSIVPIPHTNNGLTLPSNDKNLTASIDILIMSQVERCYYNRSEDNTAYLRQKPLPEKFPGLGCIHCRAKLNEGQNKQQLPKTWFFNSVIQLATGLPKIEQHLMKSCHAVPKNIRADIVTAKGQEEEERVRLRLKSGDKITRRQYATVVFDRLRGKELLE